MNFKKLSKIQDSALDMQFMDFECVYVEEGDSGITTFRYGNVYEFEDFRHGLSEFKEECKQRGFRAFATMLHSNKIKIYAKDSDNHTVFDARFEVLVDTYQLIHMLW